MAKQLENLEMLQISADTQTPEKPWFISISHRFPTRTMDLVYLALLPKSRKEKTKC
jgi:hypothetical protein